MIFKKNTYLKILIIFIAFSSCNNSNPIDESTVFRYNEHKNIVTANVTTATKITEEIRAQVLAELKSIVGDASVQVEESIDENLIGGFVLRVGDLEFNASVSNKLQKLKREYVYNPYIKEY